MSDLYASRSLCQTCWRALSPSTKDGEEEEDAHHEGELQPSWVDFVTDSISSPRVAMKEMTFEVEISHDKRTFRRNCLFTIRPVRCISSSVKVLLDQLARRKSRHRNVR